MARSPRSRERRVAAPRPAMPLFATNPFDQDVGEWRPREPPPRRGSPPASPSPPRPSRCGLAPAAAGPARPREVAGGAGPKLELALPRVGLRCLNASPACAPPGAAGAVGRSRPHLAGCGARLHGLGAVWGVKSRCVLVWPNPRRSNTRRQPENWHGWLCKLVPAADIGVIPSDTAGCGLTSSPIWTSTQLPCYLPTAERHGRCFWEHISSSTLHLCPSQLRMHRLFLTVYPTAEARAPIRLLQAFKKKKTTQNCLESRCFSLGEGLVHKQASVTWTRCVRYQESLICCILMRRSSVSSHVE